MSQQYTVDQLAEEFIRAQDWWSEGGLLTTKVVMLDERSSCPRLSRGYSVRLLRYIDGLELDVVRSALSRLSSHDEAESDVHVREALAGNVDDTLREELYICLYKAVPRIINEG